MITEGVFFESDALPGERLLARSLTGVDELNCGYRFRVRIVMPVSAPSDEELRRMLESPARLVFIEKERELNRFSGIISELSLRPDVEHDSCDLELELVPRTFLLSHRRGSEVFLGRSVPEIIAEKLIANGLSADRDFSFVLRGHYPRREFVAQYEETDLAFVNRLCEHLGIVTFFEQRETGESLVFTDQEGAFRPILRSELPHRQRTDHPAAWLVRTTMRRVPRDIQSHDYNYRAPLVSLRELQPSKRPVATGEWTEFGAHPKTADETREMAVIRSQEWSSQHHVVDAHTNEASVRAGGLAQLVSAALARDTILLTRAEYAFRHAVEGESEQPGWENRVMAIPSDVMFRPPRRTPIPRVPGLLNATVDGEIRGDYAELDEQGRYHLRMAYDRSGRTDRGATHPVRMMQSHAGAHYGMHFPLRPGAEVLVGFVNADPDRPVIVGTAPNPVTQSPVVLANQTQNVLRTGSDNEMVIEDLKGVERIRLHTPHMETTLQLGSVEEPEDGVYATTQAHVSAASKLSNNVMTDRQAVIARTAATLTGNSALIVAGLQGINSAADRGLESPASLSHKSLERDLARLAQAPAERRESSAEEPPSDADSGDGQGGLASAIAAAAAVRAESSALSLVREASHVTDEGVDRAQGRTHSEALGDPLDPSAIVASDRTAALVGRDSVLVFGDRVAALSSHETATVVGNRVAQLKSPGLTEVAGAERVHVTSAGALDIAANTARLVAGYYPDAEAPPLDEGVSLGVMARNDLRLHSVEDCILLCAKKNLIGSAHTGDIRLTAERTVSLKGGSIVGSAGTISLNCETMKVKAEGDIEVEAGGDVKVKASTVTIEAGTIRLVGTVLVEGNLYVSGDSNL